MFEFEYAIGIDEYTWTTSNSEVCRDMVRWAFEGSNDGEDWKELHTTVEVLTLP